VFTNEVYGIETSLTLNMYISSPPATPSKPNGPTTVTSGLPYYYSTNTTDPEGEKVRYKFDWGDGTTTITDWYPSGYTVRASHTWFSPGIYYVRVRAQDEAYLWSDDWSPKLIVNVTSGGGGEPCPTLFVWNGTSFVDYGVIDIHNPSGEDVIREVPILKDDVAITGYRAKFRLREGWPGLNFSESEIDHVKLYAVDKSGHHYLCPLVKAEHSQQGNVLLQLLYSDDRKTQLLLLETIDLTFIVPYPTSRIKSYTFIIEGCNMLKQ